MFNPYRHGGSDGNRVLKLEKHRHSVFNNTSEQGSWASGTLARVQSSAPLWSVRPVQERTGTAILQSLLQFQLKGGKFPLCSIRTRVPTCFIKHQSAWMAFRTLSSRAFSGSLACCLLLSSTEASPTQSWFSSWKKGPFSARSRKVAQSSLRGASSTFTEQHATVSLSAWLCPCEEPLPATKSGWCWWWLWSKVWGWRHFKDV